MDALLRVFLLPQKDLRSITSAQRRLSQVRACPWPGQASEVMFTDFTDAVERCACGHDPARVPTQLGTPGHGG